MDHNEDVARVPRYKLKDEITDSYVEAIIDSGSTVSIINRKYVTAKMKIMKMKNKKKIVTANNKESDISEEIVVNLEGTGPTNMLVANLREDLPGILGIDWMKRTNAQFSYPNQTVEFVTATGERRILRSKSNELNMVSVRMFRKMVKRHEVDQVYEVDIQSKGKIESNVEKEEPEVPTCIRKLLSRFPMVYPLEPKLSSLPPMRETLKLPTSIIDTGDSKPIKSAYYGMGGEDLQELKSQLSQLMNSKLVRPSNSPWGSPCLFVKKKDGSRRLVVDYRRVNALTKMDSYPLPRIQDNIDRLGKAKVFTVMDATAGFHQNRLQEEDVPKTAFTTKYGLYEFLVTPFGLKNSPSAFQRLMNTVLGAYLDDFCVCYVDDLVIFSENMDEHLRHLELISERLKKYGIVINLRKTKFCTSQFLYCGFLLEAGKCTVDPAKTALLDHWPTPTNVTAVRSFLGFVGFYRRLIRNFAGIAAPLTDLTKKDCPWRWTLLEQKAFNELRRAMKNSPILVLPLDDGSFTIKVDAGPLAIGGVLEQDHGVVAYEYHRLTPAETRYSQYEREFLAALTCLRKWKHYIQGKKVRLETDNSGLVHLLKQQRDPHHRIARWLDEFAIYSPDLVHVQGTQNVADAPSRLDIPYLGGAPISDLDTDRGLELNAVYASDVLQTHIDDVADWPLLVCHYLLSRRWPQDLPPERVKFLEKEVPNFGILDDKLVRIKGLLKIHYLPQAARTETMERFHTGLGHLKYESVSELLERRFWWPSMKKEMKEFIRNCPQCQLASSNKVIFSKPPIMPVPSVAVPFERWALDFMGPYDVTSSGNRYILTAIDYATRWVVCSAVPEATNETVVSFLHNLITDHGCPTEIITDRGKAFLAKAVEDFCRKHKIVRLITTPYHPQTNGMVERMHAMLGHALTTLTNGHSLLWDLFLKQALFAIRVRRHAVTKYSPYFLVYGVHPRLPGDLRDPKLPPVQASDVDIMSRNTQTMIELGYARKNAYLESKLQAERMKKRNHDDQKEYFFQIGDWVKRKDKPGPIHKKITFKWTGPFMIAEVGHPGTYWLRKPSGEMLSAPINQIDLAPWLANTRDNVSFFYEPQLPSNSDEQQDVSNEDV